MGPVWTGDAWRSLDYGFALWRLAGKTQPMKTREPNENHSITQARVLYADTDKMGVVYHSNYFRWFEAGRGSYMRRRGRPYSQTESAGVQLPLVEAGITYHKPALYEQVLEICTWVAEMRAVQLTFAHEIRHRGDVLVRGFTRHAAINREGRPTRIPDEGADALQRPETHPDEPF